MLPLGSCWSAREKDLAESGDGYIDENSADITSAEEGSAEESKTETKKSNISPPLWKVTNKDTGAVLWLFGSFGFADEKAYPLPDKVMEAYESSNILFLSRNYIDEKVDTDKSFKLYRYSDGSTAKNIFRRISTKKPKT